MLNLDVQPAENVPLTVVSHSELEEKFFRRRSRQPTNDDYEIEALLLLNRDLRYGEFLLNQPLVDYLHSTRTRKRLMDVLRANTIVTHSHLAGKRSTARTFTLPGLIEHNPHLGGQDLMGGVPGVVGLPGAEGVPGGRYEECIAMGLRSPRTIAHDYLLFRNISGDWLARRSDRWTEWEIAHGYSVSVDIRGGQPWAAPQRLFLEQLQLPFLAYLEGYCVAQLLIWQSLVQGPVVPRFRRIWGRCYGPATNLSKAIRHMAKVDGEAVCEVDIHACFQALVVSGMPASSEKDYLIEHLVSGDFHTLFEAPFQAYRNERLSDGKVPPENTRGALKVEVQRQLLFGRQALARYSMFRWLQQQFPLFANQIRSMRRCGAPALARDLMQRESMIVVDSVLPRLSHAAYCLHDAILVGQSHVRATRAELERALTATLGFCPKVRVKQPEIR